MKIVNPATENVLADVELADAAEVDRAVERARKAQAAWREVAPGERARLLRRFAGLVDEHGEELARLEVANAGHTIGNARWEAGNVRDVLHF
ncbi:aldehyde dehydrogenase family protein, partial [Nonomuraea sp. NPDC004297]